MTAIGTPGTCVECGTGFYRQDPRQKTCSRYCRMGRRVRQRRERHERTRRENPELLLLAHARHRAKKSNVPFEIEPEHVYIPSHCPLLGIELKPGDGTCEPSSPSLDRIDPDKGYTPDNVWVISHRANCIKSNATPEEIAKIYVGLLERGYV